MPAGPGAEAVPLAGAKQTPIPLTETVPNSPAILGTSARRPSGLTPGFEPLIAHRQNEKSRQRLRWRGSLLVSRQGEGPATGGEPHDAMIFGGQKA